MAHGAVIVTGSSSGIGRATALHLDRLGFRVFAGVREPEDGEALAERARGALEPLIVDVTQQSTIDAALARVSDAIGDGGLAGLVNNAGTAGGAPLELLPEAELRRQFDVNFFGAVAMTQAFLPLLRQARGRIVNISSIGGRSASPGFGAYNASKFALEAASDVFRLELHPWGIHVAVIEPGSIATDIWDSGIKTTDRLTEQMPQGKRKLYDPMIAAVRAAVESTAAEGIPPEEVAKRIEHALTAERPRTRYLVGRDAKIRAIVSAVLPDRAMDALIRRLMKLN